MSQDFSALTDHGKSISGLTPALEQQLKEMAGTMVPHLPKITDAFYVRLLTLPATSGFLRNHAERLDYLKKTHLDWLTSLFTQPIDANFTEKMVKVGDTHIGVQLPLEFMVGAMYLINKDMIPVIIEEFGNDKDQCVQALQAVNAVFGFTLIIMQQSYKLWD